MKLLELLIQEKVQWPDGALWAVQDGDNELKFADIETPPGNPELSSSGMVWLYPHTRCFVSMDLAVRASDWATKAVSKAEYDAAVAANAEREPVAPMPPLVVTTPVLHWYKLLAPVIAAAAEGKVVQYLAADGNWYTNQGTFMHPSKYRIKPEEPKTIKVNGFDVPEPMREAPVEGVKYYVADPTVHGWCVVQSWDGYDIEQTWLSRGVAHSSEEAAAAHAKAMLGIDPYATEDADDEHA